MGTFAPNDSPRAVARATRMPVKLPGPRTQARPPSWAGRTPASARTSAISGASTSAQRPVASARRWTTSWPGRPQVTHNAWATALMTSSFPSPGGVKSAIDDAQLAADIVDGGQQHEADEEG